jgi:hypothetical protein
LRGRHHLAKVEQRLHQRSRVGVDLLGEVGQRCATSKTDRLAVAVRQPHTTDDRGLHVLVFGAFGPLRLAATARCTARTPECAGSTTALAGASTASAAGTATVTAAAACGWGTDSATTTTAAAVVTATTAAGASATGRSTRTAAGAGSWTTGTRRATSSASRARGHVAW